MKRLMTLILSLLIANSAIAGNTPNLKIKVSGTTPRNSYFLCLSNVGCVSIYAAAHGKIYPIDAGHVDYIFTTNARSLRMYTQSLPASCNITLSNDQTLTVSGKLIKTSNGNNVHIENLKCTVSHS